MRKLTAWPPDVFAIAGYILHKTGGYQVALNDGLYKNWKQPYVERLCACAKEWRQAVMCRKRTPPAIQDLWQVVLDHADFSLKQLRAEPDRVSQKLFCTLLDVIACADAACEGLGLPDPDGTGTDPENLLLLRAAENLVLSYEGGGASSMCEKVMPAAVCVLPRLHTPQTGFTFRSLTHHLALWPSDELAPYWYAEMANPLTWREQDTHLLLIPHPSKIETASFSAVPEPQAGRHRMNERFRKFRYDVPDNSHWLEKELPRIVRQALKVSPDRRVDGVVLPELSLRGEKEFRKACEEILDIAPGAFVVAGVGVETGGKHLVNTAQIMVPLARDKNEHEVTICIQTKHHRWLLEESQIKHYGLGGVLDSGVKYWEDTTLGQREVNFFPLKRSFTLCVLVCEDLARQEPAARLIRAVGPHLAIALLMDGPQMKERWSGRYAGVLAEDPGCSVLTLTSLGMAQMGKPRPPSKSSVCIGLWRDANSPAREINLPVQAAGVLLSLKRPQVTEFSADGRKADAYSLKLENDKQVQPVYIRHRPR
jgi:hypothetical protein